MTFHSCDNCGATGNYHVRIGRLWVCLPCVRNAIAALEKMRERRRVDRKNRKG